MALQEALDFHSKRSLSLQSLWLSQVRRSEQIKLDLEILHRIPFQDPRIHLGESLKLLHPNLQRRLEKPTKKSPKNPNIIQKIRLRLQLLNPLKLKEGQHYSLRWWFQLQDRKLIKSQPLLLHHTGQQQGGLQDRQDQQCAGELELKHEE